MSSRILEKFNPTAHKFVERINPISCGRCRPSSDPARGTCLQNYGNILHEAYVYQRNEETVNEAICVLQEASSNMPFSPVNRFSAANNWAEIATMSGHSSCLTAYRTCVDLLLQLVAFHLDLKSRQEVLAASQITSIASASATCAIALKENNVAVEFLEASRSIFWAQALHLRTPFHQFSQFEGKSPVISPNIPLAYAGIYTEDGADCTADYVVSFYTPTLTALLDHPAETEASFKVTAVVEGKAPNFSPLPGTEEELSTIKDRVPNEWLTALLNPTGPEVVENLQGSSIIHFACHGIQDSKNALDSGLKSNPGLPLTPVDRTSKEVVYHTPCPKSCLSSTVQ
ncbi:hypothetical protein B0H19DRAFT_1068047 [Mycena capillaripes]|nr:hypothetical protein B0H19DRAFT_1068047 [Mycena capillaripes]